MREGRGEKRNSVWHGRRKNRVIKREKKNNAETEKERERERRRENREKGRGIEGEGERERERERLTGAVRPVWGTGWQPDSVVNAEVAVHCILGKAVALPAA